MKRFSALELRVHIVALRLPESLEFVDHLQFLLNNRRHFLRTLAFAPPLACCDRAFAQDASLAVSPSDARASWTTLLIRVAEPVVSSLAANQLKSRMPVECPKGNLAARRAVTHLEALGRTMSGLAPWLASSGEASSEETERSRIAELSRRAITNATDPASADHLNFTAGAQNLVDAAFLALGLARGRAELWDKLEPLVRDRLTAALTSTRRFTPGNNNWLLFSAMVEAFLASSGSEWKLEPIETAFRAHQEWYKGDGAYGDGPEFHWDYYNSFVIHPFLLEILELLQPVTKKWADLREPILKRARRYAAVQERLIAPDGSFPPLGRSLAYRCGAFHLLGSMALRKELPESITPAQARGSLWAVIHRTLAADGTFDEAGWLRIGLAGHQPSLAESYISTGSLYLCTVAFLPLGLPPSEPFWSGPAESGTSARIWKGDDSDPDHAL
jgi:hypothetical protein